MKRLIVTRALPGGMETTTKASSLGILAIPMPLQELEPVGWNVPDGDFDGLLIGSANAFRFPSPALEQVVELPVHAVGKQTAIMAEASGFKLASVGKGGLQSVLDALPSDRPLRLLRVGGEEKVELNPPPHVEIVECVSYRLVECELTAGQLAVLRQPVCVALHSAAAARIFRNICNEFALDPGRISIVALGPRIVEAAGDGWADCVSAPEPNDDALLAMAKTLCQ